MKENGLMDYGKEAPAYRQAGVSVRVKRLGTRFKND